MKKLGCIICVLVMMLSTSGLVFADTDAAQPSALASYGVGIYQVDNHFTIQKNGLMEWRVTAYAVSSTDSISLKVELQELIGGTWMTNETMTDTGIGYAEVVGNAFASHGRSYRLKITASSNGNTYVGYSKIITY